jgi:predicted nucleic acid-binding Zn ribbon protein
MGCWQNDFPLRCFLFTLLLDMSFQPLHHVLGGLQSQYQRQEKDRAQVVAESWELVVGKLVAAQTQPIAVYRGVLKVATSSAAWAQNLVFERQRLIAKLNQILPFEITEIRFSTAQWGQKPAVATFPGDAQQAAIWDGHPSRLAIGMPIPSCSQSSEKSAEYPVLPSPTIDPMIAFQQWAGQIKLRDRLHPLCPQCRCPTPPGELARWRICALCAAQEMNHS